MSETMRRLRQDHANLSRLLTALERQVGAMERGGTVDWDIMQRIVEYCLAYPDLHHHPFEERFWVDSAARTPGRPLPSPAWRRSIESYRRRFAVSLPRRCKSRRMRRCPANGLSAS